MANKSHATYLYKLEATCSDFLSSGSDPAACSVMRDHFAYLRRLHEQGVTALVGLTLNPDPSVVGLCVFYADSEAAARSIMENDPFVAKGLARGTLYPFQIAFLEGRAW